jgi:hypothetical protein
MNQTVTGEIFVGVDADGSAMADSDIDLKIMPEGLMRCSRNCCGADARAPRERARKGLSQVRRSADA